MAATKGPRPAPSVRVESYFALVRTYFADELGAVCGERDPSIGRDAVFAALGSWRLRLADARKSEAGPRAQCLRVCGDGELL